jgi:MscS family membrane protein
MRTLFALLVATLFASSVARAAGPSCATPQDAARSLLDWQQPENDNPTLAARCLDLPPELADKPGEVARQLKAVLDAKGLYVPTDDLSLDPDYAATDGRHRVVPLPAYPLLSIEKKGETWLYSRDLVEATPTLYAELSSLKRRINGWLPEVAQHRSYLGVQAWQVIYFGLLFLASLLAGLVAQKLLADRIGGVAKRIGVQLDTRSLSGTRWPLTWLAMGAVLVWGLPDLQLGVQTSRLLLFVANAATSVAAVLVLSRLVDVGTDFFGKRASNTASKLDDQVIPLVSRASKFAIWMLGGVFIVQNLGIDVGSLLAGLGIGGLAIALAAKDTAANVFGSLTIFTDRPFQIGDWVVIGKVEGVVEEVGFRSTRVRTFYNSVVSVPNASVANTPVDNMGQRKYRRVKATLGMTYGTPPDRLQAFVDEVRAHLVGHPAVWPGTLEVHFAAFNASSLDVMLYFFLDVPDWTAELSTRAEIYMEFMRIADRLDVSFAFPSQSLYLESLPDAEMPPSLLGSVTDEEAALSAK